MAIIEVSLGWDDGLVQLVAVESPAPVRQLLVNSCSILIRFFGNVLDHSAVAFGLI
jgi:hypothetical protein